MDIFPAIDLRAGKCVRLLQGDYNRQIDYRDNPVAQAQDFESDGAQWLHVVDLDGALHGSMQNLEVIHHIVSNTKLKVEVGGGIREESTVAQLLEIGVQQVVVGTRALEDIDWFESLVKKPQFAHHIVLGLDARQGRIATRGWTETGETTITQMAEKVNDWPLAAIVYTDIACDGMLTGPNIETTRQLAESYSVPVIASGGVGRIEDIQNLATLPIRGIIVGRALYENKFTLKQALAAVKKTR
jgi:phosphoribosylformimino-5-aminoimidazole carboxamide ribotide isomerase